MHHGTHTTELSVPDYFMIYLVNAVPTVSATGKDRMKVWSLTARALHFATTF